LVFPKFKIIRLARALFDIPVLILLEYGDVYAGEFGNCAPRQSVLLDALVALQTADVGVAKRH